MAETISFSGTLLMIVFTGLVIVNAITRAKEEILDAMDQAEDKPLATKEGRDD